MRDEEVHVRAEEPEPMDGGFDHDPEAAFERIITRHVRRMLCSSACLMACLYRVFDIYSARRVLLLTYYFRVFRVRELAGRSGPSSETPPPNPPKRSKR